ncbi:fibronectin type III domain-containing protein [Streptomyces sp. NPDC060194]|uniref:fibronectin type III domain-containing protein n=1 Tax=Streptomyces sp. NPDC060194 TaxID=3347069 RepID=UPI00365E18FE
MTCTSPTFKRELFANTSFKGTPKKTDCDSAIKQDWGTGAPASGLPTNDFGVRWTVTRDFGSGGPFTLKASGLDGVRVYVDGELTIDRWKNTSTTHTKSVDLSLSQGRHTLRVDYVNWTGSAAVTFAYTPRTSAGVDKVKPLVPGSPALAFDKAKHTAKLSWSRNKEMDLAGYDVYRKVAGGSYATEPTAAVTAGATSWTDTAVPRTGEVYSYEVRARDKAGNRSAGTADKSVTTVRAATLATPTGVTAKNLPEGIAVSWKPATGAASYRVYRAEQLKDDDTPLVHQLAASPAGTAWTDTAARDNLDYHYRVTAVDAAGKESARSAEAFVDRGDQPPPPPTDVKATAVPGEGIRLTWSSLPKADIDRYYVLRSRTLEGASQGKQVGEVRRTAGATAFSFTDGDVLSGESLHYVVVPHDAGVSGAPSRTVSAVAPARLSPAAVSGLTTTVNDDNVQLAWQLNPAADHVDSYVIYIGYQKDGDWAWDEIDRLPAYETRYTHWVSSTEGETVRYAVVAADRAGNSLFTDGADFPYVTTTLPGTPPVE